MGRCDGRATGTQAWVQNAAEAGENREQLDQDRRSLASLTGRNCSDVIKPLEGGGHGRQSGGQAHISPFQSEKPQGRLMMAVSFGQFLWPPLWRGMAAGRPWEGESRKPPLIAGQVDNRCFQIHMSGPHRGP